MNYTKIPAHEADFLAKGVDSDGKKFILKPFQVAIPGTSESFEVMSCKRDNGDSSFYYNETVPKQRIVVHYTAGYLKGDMAALTRPGNHVSTPFVVARDGTIYNLFSSRYWSYHLGPGAKGGNKEMSSSAVAIASVILGYLRPQGQNLVTYMSGDAPYCTLADKDAYVVTKTPFRGYTYFAAFTDAQYKSLISLLKYLTKTYNVPVNFIPEAQRYDVYADVANFRGITTHVNYQPQSYGKWDIGPAFDWARVMSALSTVPVPPIPAPAPQP